MAGGSSQDQLKTAELHHESVLGPVIFAAIYTLIYIAVHAFVSFMTLRLAHDAAAYHLSPYLAPIGIGISSGLMTLSVGVGLKEGIRHFGAVAPDSLFKLFSIYMIGQILVLVVGHAEIYAPMIVDLVRGLRGLSAVSQDGGATAVGSAGFYTPLLAITVLIAMETYIAGVYDEIKVLNEKLSKHHRDKARALTVLAAVSLILLLTIGSIQNAFVEAQLGLKVLFISAEFGIAIATFALTAGWLNKFFK